MQWLATIVRELLGLFVDDGSFALAILVWIGVVWVASLRLGSALPGGLIFFLGLVAILLGSVLGFARKA